MKRVLGIIYMIRNKINNKAYIGQTFRSLGARINGHIKDSKKNCKYPIHRAISKYGMHNFEISILFKDRCTHDELNDLEKFFIRIYNSFNKDSGYNLTLGGGGAPGSEAGNKPVIQYTLQGEFVKEWRSIKSASISLGICRSNISNCCNMVKYNQAGGYIWRHKGSNIGCDLSNLKFLIKSKIKPVLQYDLSGNFIKRYVSATMASEITGISPTLILNNCKGVTRLPKKFIWRFEDSPLNKKEVPKYIKRKNNPKDIECFRERNSKPTLQYDLTGNFVKEYPSATAASKELNCHFDTIQKACRGQLKTAGGFVWKYKEDKESE